MKLEHRSLSLKNKLLPGTLSFSVSVFLCKSEEDIHAKVKFLMLLSFLSLPVQGRCMCLWQKPCRFGEAHSRRRRCGLCSVRAQRAFRIFSIKVRTCGLKCVKRFTHFIGFHILLGYTKYFIVQAP